MLFCKPNLAERCVDDNGDEYVLCTIDCSVPEVRESSKNCSVLGEHRTWRQCEVPKELLLTDVVSIEGSLSAARDTACATCGMESEVVLNNGALVCASTTLHNPFSIPLVTVSVRLSSLARLFSLQNSLKSRVFFLSAGDSACTIFAKDVEIVPRKFVRSTMDLIDISEGPRREMSQSYLKVSSIENTRS